MQLHLQQLQTDVANEVAQVASRIFVNNLKKIVFKKNQLDNIFVNNL